MVTEHGIVIRADASTAYVRTIRTSACEHCSSKTTCQTLGGGQEMEVEAINLAGAREGDRVVLSFRSSSLFKLSFLIYIFPVLAMIVGAVAGQANAPRYGLDDSVAAVLGCIIAFALAFGVIRLVGSRLGDDDRYRAKVIRISRLPLYPEPEESCDETEAEPSAVNEKAGGAA